MRLRDLQERRAAMVAEAKALLAKDELSEAEETRFKELETEAESLTGRIEREQRVAEWERTEAHGEPVGGPEMQRELRNYNLGKAVTEHLNGRLTGLEAAVHEELSKGRETRGVMIPVDRLFGGAETRAVTTTTPASNAGGNLIRTDLASMTDRRRPALMVELLGSTIMRGLVGNLDLPRFNASGTAYWVAEHTDTTGSDPKFEKKSMSPNTVSGEYELSRRMLLQSQEAVDTILRRDLGMILATAVDSAAIEGGGTNGPTGIIADSSVTELTGAAIGFETTADMIAALDVDDVSGTRAFLTHPNVIALARKLKDGNNLPIPLATTFHGERVESSTNVPNDGGSPALDRLIYGEWASLYVGYWSGVDILLNPYHTDVASKGGVKLHAFLDCDVVVRHPEGFRWMEITS